MAYPDIRMVLRTDQLVGDPFPINGKCQILCLMPNGASWEGRTVELQAKSKHQGDIDYWFTLYEPDTGNQFIRWDREGFIAVDGVQGFEYRMKTNLKGVQASIYPVRTWTSSRPGR